VFRSGAESYHNSDRITFKRLANYRALADGLITLGLGSTAVLQPPFERDVLNYSALVNENATTLEVVPKGAVATAAAHFRVDGKAVPASGVVEIPFPIGAVNATVVTVRDTLTAQLYTIACRREMPASVKVSGSGFSVGEFRDGATAFLNREYVWRGVPASIEAAGLRHTRTNGGQGIKVRLSPLSSYRAHVLHTVL
jgi:hypothetical protein